MAENNSQNNGANRAGAGGETAAGEMDVQANAYAMDRLSQAFENSARRWELIVYPTLFAFIILAAYGFYLVLVWWNYRTKSFW